MDRLQKGITGEKERNPKTEARREKLDLILIFKKKKMKRNISKQAFSKGLIILSLFIFKSRN